MLSSQQLHSTNIDCKSRDSAASRVERRAQEGAPKSFALAHGEQKNHRALEFESPASPAVADMDHSSQQSQRRRQQNPAAPQHAPDAMAMSVPGESPVESQKRELELVRRTLGPRHPRAAGLLSMIGLYHQHVDRDLDAALEHYEAALEVLRAQPPLLLRPTANGGKNPGGAAASHDVEIAVTLTDVGNVLRCMGRTDGAIEAYRQAMDMFEDNKVAVNRNHPGLQAASRGLALLGARCSSPGQKAEINDQR